LLLTVLHHHRQELDGDLGCRPDHHLPLATLLSIANAVQAIVEDADAHHLGWFGGGGSGRKQDGGSSGGAG